MRARVVRPRHVRTIATTLACFYGAAFIAWFGRPEAWNPVTAEEWRRAWALAGAFVLIGAAAFVVAAIVPFVVQALRPGAAECVVREGSVRVGATTFTAAEVTGFSVAPDGHGVSVAIGAHGTTTFLELDTMDDARRIATALGKRFPADGELHLTLPRQSPALVVNVHAFVAVALATFVPIFGSLLHGLDTLFACGGLLAPLLTLLVILNTRRPMKLSWGTASTIQPARRLDRSAVERHVRRHEEGRLTAPPAPPRVRVDLLERGHDSVRAWLARIDGLDRAGGYRGENAPAELLFETLRDESTPVDVRLAAARLLRVRDGEERVRIAESVADSDVRARVLAVTNDDAAAAADALDAVGPMFRAHR